MAVIWGLDLHEIQWRKFKSSYMFGNTDYHLRRTKFVVYQIAMICCVVSESLGTAALSDYVDQQDFIQRLDNRALEYNNDFVGIASFNIFVGVYVATIFGSGFFFDLFWPERRESKTVKIAWRVCAVFASVLCLADILSLTIIAATKRAYVTGVGGQRAEELLAKYGGSPLAYNQNGRVIASVVFGWIGFVGTIMSTIVLLSYYHYSDKYGPWSSHARKVAQTGDATDVDVEMNETVRVDNADNVSEEKIPTEETVKANNEHTGSPNTETRVEIFANEQLNDKDV